MNSYRVIASTLIVSAGVGQVMAADDIPVRYTRAKQNTVSVGMRITNSSSTVGFSGMGTLNRSMPDLARTPLDKFGGTPRVYDNGSLFPDEKFGDIATNETVTSGGVLNLAGRVVKDPIDRNTIYVLNERPSIDKTGDGKIVYETNRPNPIRDGRMVTTVLSYKIKVNADGVEVWKPSGLRDSRGAMIMEPEYETDANGSYVPIELEEGVYLPYSDSYVRGWQGSQGSTSVRDAQGNVTGFETGRQFHYDNQGNAIGINFENYGSAARPQRHEGQFGDGGGFEVSLERTLRRESLRLEWGLKGTLGFSGINGSLRQNISADLVTKRHTYLVAPGYGPISVDPQVLNTGVSRPAEQVQISRVRYQTDLNGNIVTDDKGVPQRLLFTEEFERETGVPLLRTPVLQPDGTYLQTITEVDAATVAGFWQIKGSYYMLRFGPSARYFFTNSISVSGSVGLGLAYYTTRFNIDEQLVTGLTDEIIAFRTNELFSPNGRDPFDNTKRGVTLGPVAEFNLEYWVTQRTGFYAGVAYERLGSFTQEIEGRKAEVKLGSGMTIRLGISTRF